MKNKIFKGMIAVKNKNFNFSIGSIFVSVMFFTLTFCDLFLWFFDKNLLNIDFDISVLLATLGLIISISKMIIARAENKWEMKRYLIVRVSLFFWLHFLFFSLLLCFLGAFNIYLLHPIEALAGVIASLIMVSVILTKIWEIRKDG